jgi:hypothetical protein
MNFKIIFMLGKNLNSDLFVNPLWETTKTFLKTLSHTIKNFQTSLISEKPCSLHHSLEFNHDGINTYELPKIGKIFINFRSGNIVVKSNSKQIIFATTIYNISLNNLIREINSHFSKLTASTLLETKENGDLLLVNSEIVQQYFSILWNIFSILSRLKAKLPLNPSSPIVFWTHHFDVGFMYFFTGIFSSENDPHINLGFSPIFDPAGKIARPYFYFFIWNGSEYVKNFPITQSMYFEAHYSVLELPLSPNENTWISLEKELFEFISLLQIYLTNNQS